MPSIDRYLTRNGVRTRDLLYLSREGGETVLHLSDGRRLTTYLAVKDFAAALDSDHFLSVNKGILVRRDAVAEQSAGLLVLTDGTRLPLRRTQRTASIAEGKEQYQMRVARRYALLDRHPLPHLLYTLSLFDGESGAVLRYQNRACKSLAPAAPEPAFEYAILAVLADALPRRCGAYDLYSPEDGYCLAVYREPYV